MYFNKIPTMYEELYLVLSVDDTFYFVSVDNAPESSDPVQGSETQG